jgi:hypothetical protein
LEEMLKQRSKKQKSKCKYCQHVQYDGNGMYAAIQALDHKMGSLALSITSKVPTTAPPAPVYAPPPVAYAHQQYHYMWLYLPLHLNLMVLTPLSWKMSMDCWSLISPASSVACGVT